MSRFTALREFLARYERYVSPVTLVMGFIFDSIMLRRIDVFFSNALLISYLLIAAISIIMLNVSESRRGGDATPSRFHFILVFMMQFCFGGLFSSSFLFYSRSGSFVSSWPFLVLILAYMVGNEFFRRNYTRLGFQVSAFFSALFSYLIFFLPVVLGKMDDSIFLLSGLSTLFITGLFIYVLSWFVPIRIKKSAPLLAAAVGGIFALVNTLYFTNLIPPIPLALKESGVYRTVTAFPDGSYLIRGEKRNFFEEFFGRYDVHVAEGDPVYAWTSVFAPDNFNTSIVHVWQRYDEGQKAWVTVNRIYLSIVGGRENGFRTYSSKDGISQGTWRVNAETPRGQLIGRLVFNVSYTDGSEELVTKVR